MRRRFSRYLFSLCTTAAVLAACGRLSQPESDAASGAFRASWMASEAKGDDLLYVSDEVGNSVYVLAYPKRKLVGMLTGFGSPAGECADKLGNVWIVNQTPAELIEYVHAGTTPIATLHLPGNTPYGCAVDRRTGNLAATSSAGVSIFASAQGAPTTYSVTATYCVYDGRGDLFVDSDPMEELPRVGGPFRSIGVFVTGVRGGLQWDGEYLVDAADPQSGTGDEVAIYQVEVTGTGAGIIGAALLTGRSFSSGSQFSLAGKTIIQPDVNGPGVALYAYPSGGSPKKNLKILGASRLWGTAVSRGKTGER